MNVEDHYKRCTLIRGVALELTTDGWMEVIMEVWTLFLLPWCLTDLFSPSLSHSGSIVANVIVKDWPLFFSGRCMDTPLTDNLHCNEMYGDGRHPLVFTLKSLSFQSGSCFTTEWTSFWIFFHLSHQLLCLRRISSCELLLAGLYFSLSPMIHD